MCSRSLFRILSLSQKRLSFAIFHLFSVVKLRLCAIKKVKTVKNTPVFANGKKT